MTSVALHNAIRSRFKTQVATPESLIVVYDNDPTSPPKAGSIWCRFSVRRSETQQVEAGPASFRLYGRAYAQLFGPLDKGDGALLELADTIVAEFLGETAAGVRYGEVTVVPVGVRGGEYQVNVEIPFMAD